MTAMILHGMPQEFQQLSIRNEKEEDWKADLATLVKRLREAAGTGPDWRDNVKKVRGQLRLHKHALSVSEPGLPNKLTDPHNQHQRALYGAAIDHLTALIGKA